MTISGYSDDWQPCNYVEPIVCVHCLNEIHPEDLEMDENGQSSHKECNIN